MAKSGDLKLIINHNNNSINAFDLLEKFMSSGWTLNYYGKISYLPLGDTDFDWHYASMDEKYKIIDILKNKINNQELVGIVITWNDTNIGINALFYPFLDKLIFNIDINRKTISSLDITDFTWYIEKLIPVILKAGLSIEVLECIDG